MSSDSRRRVVITGVGLISPIGNSKDELWAALQAKRSGVAELESIPTDGLPIHAGAEAKEFSGHIRDFGELDAGRKKAIRKGLKMMCREIQMGVAAAQLSLNDAGIEPGSYDHDRTGVVYGCDYIMTVPEEFQQGVKNCMREEDGFQFSRWAEKGLPQVTPLWLLKYLPNMPASHIAIYNDLRGPNNSITLREASANLAVAEAYFTISRGSADTIITGATGTRVHPIRTVHVALQEQLASGDADPASLSRPFDKDRSGSVLGEGAGALILESLEHAQQRGATIIGEVVGYGSSTVVNRQGIPQTETAIRNVLRESLRTSGFTPEQIGHVHAHGLATTDCDRQEAAAIKSIFGDVEVPVTAAKSYYGNLGAGGGVVELISSLLAINDGSLFPILNCDELDPQCPIKPARDGTPAGTSFINLNVSPLGQAAAVTIKTFSE